MLNGLTERVCVSSAGVPAVSNTFTLAYVAISADGRFVTFSHYATNLVAGDTNGAPDVFLRDRQLGTTERVSLAWDNSELMGNSYASALSADGRYVAFSSSAPGVVPGDTGLIDVFIRDRQAGTLTKASVSSSGTPGNDHSGLAPTLTPDGRWVAFCSDATNLVGGDTNNNTDVFVHDNFTGATERVSVSSSGVQGNGQSGIAIHSSGRMGISADGRYVAFWSIATNLVSGDTNSKADVFVRDRTAGTTTRASVGPLAVQGDDNSGYSAVYHGVSISLDGRYVAFTSAATNLIAGDANGRVDVFLRDRVLSQTIGVSVGSNPVPGLNGLVDATLSGDGRYVAFAADAAVVGGGYDIAQVFRQDRGNSTVIYCTAKPNSLGCVPAIGASGVPSASAPSGFIVYAVNVLNFHDGLLFYGINGPAAAPFQGGTFCLTSPTRRTALQNSGGNLAPPTDCSGTFAFDFNTYCASGANPALTAWTAVCAQYWSRDGQDAFGTNLTNAVSFVLGL
jgi:Tol biopolymer transport system component